VNVRDVLNRRNDLSTFVVHLTKDGLDQTAKERLESIIDEQTIYARKAMGWAEEQDHPSDQQEQTQRVVSFTETPLEHIYSHVVEISRRREKFKPYGVALTKLTARKMGINPVWYVDRTPGQEAQWEVAEAISTLKREAVSSGDFHDQPIAKLLPFFEVMGTWPTTARQKEFWWEREWRKRGHVFLPNMFRGCLILSPEDELDHFEALIKPHLGEAERRRRRRQCIDPRWGLEQIVAHLAGIPDDQVTPFGPETA
jgi:Putative abortive phage resistance protein AbiGi, antitoxin